MLGDAAYPLGCCMGKAHRDGNMSWEHINDLWRDYFAPDRRYRVYFNATNEGSTYLMRVGRQNILIQFINGVAYLRQYTHSDIYEEKPCYHCGEMYDGHMLYRRYQYEVLI